MYIEYPHKGYEEVLGYVRTDEAEQLNFLKYPNAKSTLLKILLQLILSNADLLKYEECDMLNTLSIS